MRLREEIQRCFDDKIDDMCDLIDAQLDRIHIMHPFEHIVRSSNA